MHFQLHKPPHMKNKSNNRPRDLKMSQCETSPVTQKKTGNYLPVFFESSCLRAFSSIDENEMDEIMVHPLYFLSMSVPDGEMPLTARRMSLFTDTRSMFICYLLV